MKPVQSALLSRIPGLVHGFGTRDEPIPLSMKAEWELRKPVWKQVHGAASCRVVGAGQACGDVDALWTREHRQPIAVVTADCVPVLLARRDGGAIAAVHAGWRGTRAHILSDLWRELKVAGERPSDWVAAIGPSIGPCCYEVSEELAQDFSEEFKEYGESSSPVLTEKSSREDGIGNDSTRSYSAGTLAVPRHRYLDLPAINAAELRRIGLADVDLLRFCTRCGEGFHSYRREGAGTRQYSMLMRE